MCMFCAAIPMTASMGVAVTARLQEKQSQTTKTEQKRLLLLIPPKIIMAILLLALIVCSAIYHIVIAPQTGIFV